MSFRKVGFLAIALGVCLLANDLMAQPGGGRGRGGPGGGFGFGRGGGSMAAIGLLRNEDVRNKIDLADDQYEDIQKVQEDMQAKMRDAFQDRDFEAIRGINEDAEKEIKDILLDKQWKTLQTISNQQRYIRGGTLRISQQFLTETLEMSEGDAEKAMEDYEALQKEYQKKMSKLAQEMMDDFAKSLPSDARKAFKEMMGDEIIPIQQQRPQFGGRGRTRRSGWTWRWRTRRSWRPGWPGWPRWRRRRFLNRSSNPKICNIPQIGNYRSAFFLCQFGNSAPSAF